MGSGISGAGRGGFFEQMGGAVKNIALENRMMNEMDVPVQKGDNKGAQERFQSVRELANQLSPEKAGELLDHLNSKDKNDSVAQKILHTFGDASVEKLKSDLRVASGRAGAGEVLRHKADEILRSPKEKHTRKTEFDLEGQLKALDLKDLADKLMGPLDRSTATHRAEKMFKAADVMHKDPDAILSALGDLTTNQMKQLQKVFPEKYGVSLEVFLKNQLQGPKLNLALDMVRSGNTVGATHFHVIE